jgi:hypothetical protein
MVIDSGAAKVLEAGEKTGVVVAIVGGGPGAVNFRTEDEPSEA